MKITSKYSCDSGNLVLKLGSTILEIYNGYGDGTHNFISFEVTIREGIELYRKHTSTGNWEEIMHIRGPFKVLNYDCLHPNEYDDPRNELKAFDDPEGEYVLLRSTGGWDGDFMLIKIGGNE